VHVEANESSNFLHGDISLACRAQCPGPSPDRGLEALKGHVIWPPIVDGALTLTPAQFSVLVEAMDWRRTVAPPPPTQPMLV
jgi:hypothetical protein